MHPQHLASQARETLHYLCDHLPTRRVGSAGNREATDLFADRVQACGFETTSPQFDCMDWRNGGAKLSHGPRAFPVFTSPYSLGCQVEAPLVVAASLADLESIDARDRILLVHGDLVGEQLMPKNFIFYNPERHQRIIQLFEKQRPQAIIAATTRNPEMAGAVYPFPLLEDGDFDIPSVYMTAEESGDLIPLAGQPVCLEIQAQRIAATGCNVVARKGRSDTRVVLFAHIDAKEGTPGAIDNATGVITLLLLAELLTSYTGSLTTEIVALNGEDYYAASGEMLWLEQNRERFHEILLGINLDGIGYHRGKTAYSLYACPPELEEIIHAACSQRPTMIPGQPWYQSDHSIFISQGVPALAFTSSDFTQLWTEIAHTAADTPDIVDVDHLVEAALTLASLLMQLDHALLNPGHPRDGA